MASRMNGIDLYEAGFRELVSVIPPDAELSGGSKIKPRMLGKVPGRRGKDGKWYGYPFTTAPAPTRREVARWVNNWRSNIGLMADRYPALDIDTSSASLARLVEAEALRLLGPAPIRHSVQPRRLLMYRTETPFPRMALLLVHGGKKHLIEFLGAGRQYLVAGTHPSGNEYRWNGSLSPDTLTPVQAEQVHAFLDGLAATLRQKGLQVERIGEGAVIGAAGDRSQTELQAPSDEELAACVREIPNDARFDERTDFLRMACAIKAACHDEASGLEVFREWAERWESGDNAPEYIETTWETLSGPFRVGWDWLREQGGISSAADDFADSVDLTAAPAAPEPDTVKYSDVWLMEQALPAVQQEALYVPLSDTWMVWDRYRWVRDELARARKIAREQLLPVAKDLEERAKTGSRSRATKLLGKADRAQSTSGILSVMKLLEPELAVRPTDFDTDPWLLNTPAGVVDLRTGITRPVTREDMLRLATAVAPVPGVPRRWLEFLRDLTAGDEDVIDYLQKSAGYALTGEMYEKLLQYLWGGTDTGKSQFVHVLTALLGDYAAVVSADTFMRSKNDRVPADLAQLLSVRLVTATEPEAGKAWDEQRIKAITGGDKIQVRLYYGQYFVTQPTYKILVVGNSEPEIRHVDDAMLKRIHIVPLNNRVPKERQIPDYWKVMVEEEGPQILQWAIEGCLRWQKEGLEPPDMVRRKMTDYAAEEDQIQQWLDNECELGPEFCVTRQELYQSWASWCNSHGEWPGKFRSFRRIMAPKERLLRLDDILVGAERRVGYMGIRLRPVNVDEFTTEE